MLQDLCFRERPLSLNESPSEKEGKLSRLPSTRAETSASMKALPKRKGNSVVARISSSVLRLNESPSEKEGKSSSRGR